MTLGSLAVKCKYLPGFITKRNFQLPTGFNRNYYIAGYSDLERNGRATTYGRTSQSQPCPVLSRLGEVRSTSILARSVSGFCLYCVAVRDFTSMKRNVVYRLNLKICKETCVIYKQIMKLKHEVTTTKIGNN